MKTLFIGLSAALFLIPATARAQLVPGLSFAQIRLTPDRTLGNESSVVVPVSNTRDDISGGARRGSNLFHSFREFNVNTNREVYFSNPTGVQNIINRVTGSNISNIFGTLGVSGNANLYLINPNGIVFGEGAFLDINGTFIGTTADGVRLGANDVYSASDPASSSLLTIQPEALFVNRKNAQIRAILNQGNLEANPGANVTLSADEINNSGSITVPGGNVFLEAVNGDINTANIDVSSPEVNEERIGNGGNISLVSSGNINVLDGSGIVTIGILGGSINIESQGDLRANNAVIGSRSTGNVRGFGRDINVNARSIELNSSALTNQTQGEGDAGDLTIKTDTLSILDGAQISASTFSIGNGGNLNITAKNIFAIGVNPVLDGFASGLLTGSGSGATGDAGDLTIKTDTLSIRDGAQIAAGTFSDGNGGNLNITAKNIEAIGVNSVDSRFASGLFTRSNSGATGDAGNLTISTDSLVVRDGAQISAGSASGGNGGNLNITAKNIEAIGVDPLNASFPSGLFTQTSGEGNAGELTVTTNNLLISDRAVISAATFGTGNSNNINLFADNIRIENNGFVAVFSTETGLSGNLNIQGNSIKLDRGIITGESFSGAGGNINITLTESLTLTNSSRITTEAGVDRLGTGDGGNIEIDSRLIIASPEDNIITADAFGGTGGNINITTNAIFGYPQFLTITASSELGIDGTINITGVTDLNSDILPAEPVIITTTPPQLAKCPIQGQSTELNSEIDYGTGEKIKLELFRRNNSNPEAEQQKQPESKPKPSKPAVGWYRRTDGTVVLTDNPAKVRPLNQPIDYPAGCY